MEPAIPPEHTGHWGSMAWRYQYPLKMMGAGPPHSTMGRSYAYQAWQHVEGWPWPWPPCCCSLLSSYSLHWMINQAAGDRRACLLCRTWLMQACLDSMKNTFPPHHPRLPLISNTPCQFIHCSAMALANDNTTPTTSKNCRGSRSASPSMVHCSPSWRSCS